MDCVTGSPMADTCVRQVVPGRWGGEACARVCPQQQPLHPEEYKGGGLSDGDGGIAVPLRTLDAIAGLPASAHLGDGRARWQGGGV